MENREYNLKKWESKDKSKILKTKREKKIIDMREKNIEEELINKRMASRDLIIQGLINPYLFENNYLDDINNQDRFLRPKDSNQKEKIQ